MSPSDSLLSPRECLQANITRDMKSNTQAAEQMLSEYERGQGDWQRYSLSTGSLGLNWKETVSKKRDNAQDILTRMQEFIYLAFDNILETGVEFPFLSSRSSYTGGNPCPGEVLHVPGLDWNLHSILQLGFRDFATLNPQRLLVWCLWPSLCQEDNRHYVILYMVVLTPLVWCIHRITVILNWQAPQRGTGLCAGDDIMPMTRVPSKGSGVAAGKLGNCREVEWLTVFYSGYQSMDCDLHTVAAKSVEVSDCRGPQVLPQSIHLLWEGLGHLSFSCSQERWYILEWENILPVWVSQLGGAEDSFSKTEWEVVRCGRQGRPEGGDLGVSKKDVSRPIARRPLF